jgi:hypothetical protein
MVPVPFRMPEKVEPVGELTVAGQPADDGK